MNKQKKSAEWLIAETQLALGELSDEAIEALGASERLKFARKVIHESSMWCFQDKYPTCISIKLMGWGFTPAERQRSDEVRKLVERLCFRITYTTEKNRGRYSPAGTPRYQFVG